MAFTHDNGETEVLDGKGGTIIVPPMLLRKKPDESHDKNFLPRITYPFSMFEQVHLDIGRPHEGDSSGLELTFTCENVYTHHTRSVNAVLTFWCRGTPDYTEGDEPAVNSFLEFETTARDFDGKCEPKCRNNNCGLESQATFLEFVGKTVAKLATALAKSMERNTANGRTITPEDVRQVAEFVHHGHENTAQRDIRQYIEVAMETLGLDRYEVGEKKKEEEEEGFTPNPAEVLEALRFTETDWSNLKAGDKVWGAFSAPVSEDHLGTVAGGPFEVTDPASKRAKAPDGKEIYWGDDPVYTRRD